MVELVARLNDAIRTVDVVIYVSRNII